MAKFYSIDIDSLNMTLRESGLTRVRPLADPSIIRVSEPLATDLEQIRAALEQAWDEGFEAGVVCADGGDGWSNHYRKVGT